MASKGPSLAKTSADSGEVESVSPRDVALWIAEAALEKKAEGIEIIDVRGKVDYADFIVLMSGMSDRHVKAVAQGVEEDMGRLRGVQALSIEGLPSASWVLVDFVDVVVHVFLESMRGEYDLGGLWMDAPRVPVPEPTET